MQGSQCPAKGKEQISSIGVLYQLAEYRNFEEEDHCNSGTKNFSLPKPESGVTPNNGIQIFPNPANDRLFVILENSLPKERVQIRMHDLTGKLLKTQYFENDKLRLEIDISDLPNGIYSASIVSDKIMLKSMKIIVIH